MNLNDNLVLNPVNIPKAGDVIGTGKDGKDGTTFYPEVSADGVISWTNDGRKANPEPVVIKGEKGDPGKTGEPGRQGDKGDPGNTPVKGVDYFTDADKADIEGDLTPLLDNKVDKLTDSRLISNDEATKLAGIASNAEVNIIESVTVNGTPVPIDSKTVNIDLTGYAKTADISSAYRYKGTVATKDDLPTKDRKAGDVWNCEDSDANYAWTGSKWDSLGGSTVDLSAYATTEAMNEALTVKVDKTEGSRLITDTEAEKLKGLSNYDDSSLVAALGTKVDKVAGYSMVAGTQITAWNGAVSDVSKMKTSISSIETNVSDLQTAVGDVETALGVIINGAS